MEPIIIVMISSFIVGVLSFYVSVKFNNNIGALLTLFCFCAFFLSSLGSFNAVAYIEYKKLPDDKVELIKTKDHVLVIDHKGRGAKFDDKRDHRLITDSTTFYYKNARNAWGWEVDWESKEGIIPEYKKSDL